MLAVPALFIAGEEDIVIPPAVLAATAKLIPGARMEYIARAGHSAQFERAAEWNRLVDAFIAATS